jgi:hypothetical protein
MASHQFVTNGSYVHVWDDLNFNNTFVAQGGQGHLTYVSSCPTGAGECLAPVMITHAVYSSYASIH